ncbi:MAG: glycosyltransferase family 39 protein [Gemmataceae bacterium]|nr:glycosyltransferase family 39 protein [Gemmataceae bacterium]
MRTPPEGIGVRVQAIVSTIATRKLAPGPTAVATVLIAAIAGLRIAYLLSSCPLELAADEAHYWDWSRHLDWSYYSKGPLVAWMIRASCELFGDLSQRLVGSPLLAIRLPAIFCQAGALAGTYLLSLRVTRDPRVALFTMLVLFTIPAIAAGGTVMTIDAPYCCAWVWACVFAHAAIVEGRTRAWPALGVALAVGILAKYTMLVFIPSIMMFLVFSRAHRSQLARSGLWIAVGIGGLAALPILLWNARNGWVTFRHVGTQAGTTASQLRLLGPLRYVVEQAGLLMIFWFVAWAGAMWKHRPGRTTDAGRQLLWWTSAPMFAVFLAVTLRTPGQVNWPITAYVGGMILAVEWWLEHRRSYGPRYRRITTGGFAVTCVMGLLMSLLLHVPAAARPLILAVTGPGSAKNPMPIRRLDPTARLRGWRHLAAEVDAVRRELRQAGEPEPVIAASFWTIPGELAVYCEGHPETTCIGTPLAQRMSQYDLWRPNPVWDPEQFVGRTFIYVGDISPEVAAAFEHLEPTRMVEYREGGEGVAFWRVTVARGFRGFGPPDVWPGSPRY